MAHFIHASLRRAEHFMLEVSLGIITAQAGKSIGGSEAVVGEIDRKGWGQVLAIMTVAVIRKKAFRSPAPASPFQGYAFG